MRTLACITAVGTLALAACGGGTSGGDSGQIRRVVGAIAELKSKSVCNSDFTDSGVEDFFQDHTSAAAARKDCTDNVGQEHISASDLNFRSIAVNGQQATAIVSLKGRAAKIGLTKQGTWKVSSIKAG